LRQLIEAQASQEPADAGKPASVWQQMSFFISSISHGSKFEQQKRSAMKSWSSLPK
jgi:hypothetical protein